MQPLFAEWLNATCVNDECSTLDDANGELPCVEFFARELRQGWLCAGDEVLRFQLSSHFNSMPARSPTQTKKQDEAR